MKTAYLSAVAQSPVDYTNYLGGALNNAVLLPGVYNFTVPVVIGANLVLSGLATDVYVFQLGLVSFISCLYNRNLMLTIVPYSGALSQAGSTTVTLLGGILASRIFFAVNGTTTLGASASFKGIILAKTSVAFGTASSMTGRVYSQTAVTLLQTVITTP